MCECRYQGRCSVYVSQSMQANGECVKAEARGTRAPMSAAYIILSRNEMLFICSVPHSLQSGEGEGERGRGRVGEREREREGRGAGIKG